MNFEQARINMIKQQIRSCEVLDDSILDLFDVLHREDFVPEPYRHLALADTPIPLAHGQQTMTPMLEARILQFVSVRTGDNVLEIGSGCGYMTALLGKSGKTVHSVDIFQDFTDHTARCLQLHGINNVQLYTGDAVQGWPDASPYDVIIVTGSVPVLEPHFQQQLRQGGRLFIVVGKSPAMEARLITRTGPDSWDSVCLLETDLPPLVGAPEPEPFQF